MNFVVLLLRKDVLQALRWKVVPTLVASIFVRQVFLHFGFQTFTVSLRWLVLLIMLFFYGSSFDISFSALDSFTLSNVLTCRFSTVPNWRRFPLIFLVKKMIALILLLWWMVWVGAAHVYKIYTLHQLDFLMLLCLLLQPQIWGLFNALLMCLMFHFIR